MSVQPSKTAPRESLLVFSDVHLGSDLIDHGNVIKRSSHIDRDLVRFLEHYRSRPPGDSDGADASERWRIVIAGDFIDFIGMSVDPTGPLATDLTDEERLHGLGNASDHAREKLRRVAKRHREIFDALARFIACGHALTIVHGNHDVEFHWDGVQADFRALLAERAGVTGAEAEAFVARIDFNPWFFYWGGVAYIEHGHQYDPFCATENVMAPLSPLDPRRVARGFCDVLLRYVVRPTIGMRQNGHETKGALDYLAFGMHLGLRGMVQLGVRFFEAVVELFRLRRAYFTDAAKALREEHERRVALLAEATRIGMDRIRALAALQTPPVTRSIRGILASVLLDRLAFALACAIAMAVTAVVLGVRSGHFVLPSLVIASAWGLGHRHLVRARQLDPAEQMAERANHLARLLPAAFVVMGHTHAPAEKPVADGTAKYINLGSWAEDEPETGADDASAYHAARTHLVIHFRDGHPTAELRAWDAEGPRKFVS